MKIAFINGEFVPETEAKVSVFDRSFLLGDGLFETVPVYGTKPFLWGEHLARLRSGAQLVAIRVPYSDAELTEIVSELLRKNLATEGIVRLHLSRGVGRRGYSPSGANQPTLVLTFHEATDPRRNPAQGWRLGLSTFRLPAGDAFATVKSASKLLHVLARAETERRDCDEALLVNPEGQLVEGASSNVFWIEDQTVCTPPLNSGALAGITRAFVLKLAPELGLRTSERCVPPNHLVEADGVFLTLSSFGIVPAVSFEGQSLREPKVLSRLQDKYRDAIASRPSAWEIPQGS